ncbi:hypothetical protein JW992_08700 [candidate division KSB1 bacterium]|nr:hypothetical protein [candidate division KSB1 bacterium]
MNENELKKAWDLFAHKLTNPLHAASLNLEVARAKLENAELDKKTLQHLRLVAEDLVRMQKLVDRFNRYLEQDEAGRKKIALRDWLQR